MKSIIFDWDINKNLSNIKKHGVSFLEASSVFYDDEAIIFDDPIHSITEERFNIIGMSNKLNLLIVNHCYRRNDDLIRIISARKATKKEPNDYLELKKGIV